MGDLLVDAVSGADIFKVERSNNGDMAVTRESNICSPLNEFATIWVGVVAGLRYGHHKRLCWWWGIWNTCTIQATIN